MPKKKPVIFISDLHIDRWDRDKRDLFFEFLDYAEKAAAEMYVLGDILDFPALKGERVWPKHSEAINRLRGLPAKGVPLTYLVGNHDISLRGVEIDEDGFTLTYCDSKNPVERELHGKKVYMDHGHFYDPLFQDHIYDAMDFLRSVTGQAVDRRAVDFLRDVVRIFQRRPKHKEMKAAPMDEVGVPERFLKIWDQAAEQLLKRMRYDIVFFGHTHAPAIVEFLGQQQWYVNTGDWVDHANYVLLTDEGIQLMNWPEKEPVQEILFGKKPG